MLKFILFPRDFFDPHQIVPGIVFSCSFFVPLPCLENTKVPSESSASLLSGFWLLWLKCAEPPMTRHRIRPPSPFQILPFRANFVVPRESRCFRRERAYGAFERPNIDLRNGFRGSSELYLLIINTINAFLCTVHHWQIFDLYSALEEDDFYHPSYRS